MATANVFPAIDATHRAVFVARMFIIIGGDGKEYGPVTAEQVRAWMKAGRANLDTQAKALGTDDWRRLGDFAEFAPPMDTPPMIQPDMGAPVIPGAITPKIVSDQTRADRGTRLVARIIDWVIEGIVAIPGAMILGPEFLRIVISVSQGNEPDFEDLDYHRLLLGFGVMGITWLALLVVQVWMLSTRGQSIGKRLTKIRVVRVEDGSNPGFVNAWLMRELLITAIGIALSMIPILGPFLLRPAFHLVDWCLIFRDDQLCLHDLIAKTKVVKA